MNEHITNLAQIAKLESMVEELYLELSEAKFSLGELPSQSDAVLKAGDYLKKKTENSTDSTLVKQNIPMFLRKQAI